MTGRRTTCRMPGHIILCITAFLLCASHAGAHSYKLRRHGIRPGDYSGITPIGGGLYAVVSDKEPRAGFHVWRLDIDAGGRLRAASAEGFRGEAWPIPRDAEGVALCPWRGSVFVSGEEDQRIVEHSLADGRVTGAELAVPPSMGRDRIQANRGFEALCCDTVRRLFWTVTESPLPGDAPDSLRLLCFGSDLRPLAEYAYRLGPERYSGGARGHLHGVVALAAMDDGRLLVLEREAAVTRRYMGSRCLCRLVRFSPAEGRREVLREWETRFSLARPRFANYEGMCLGPVLPDGRQTVLLVSDSQGGYGRLLWHLRDRLMIIVL